MLNEQKAKGDVDKLKNLRKVCIKVSIHQTIKKKKRREKQRKKKTPNP